MKKKKSIVYFVLSLIMVSAILKNTFFQAVFVFDRAYFTQTFCENTDKPELKCNGKCALAKMQQESDDKNASNTLEQVQTEILYYNQLKEMLVFGPFDFAVIEKTLTPSYYKIYSYLFSTSFNKPPEIFTV